MTLIYKEKENILKHHGILGQKWGRRRYQKKDGTRTSAGKKRERSTDKKTIKSMSNQELIDRINRLELEQRYRTLLKNDSKSSKAMSSAKQYASDLGKKTVNSFVNTGVQAVGRELSNMLVTAVFSKGSGKK